MLVPAAAEDARRNNFDVIRLFMSLLVIFSHSFHFWFGDESSEPIHVVLGHTFTAGTVAVMVFFIISGFLITSSFENSRTIRSYFEKRVRRIYPGFIVAVMICTVIVIPAFATGGLSALSARSIATAFLSTVVLRAEFPETDAFGGAAVNGSLWTIPFEFWCYLGVIGLGVTHLLRRRAFVATLLVAILAGKALLDLTGRRPGGGLIEAVIGFPYLWFTIAPAFLCGMVVYLYRDRIPRSRLTLAACVLTPLIAATVLPQYTARLIAVSCTLPICLSYIVFHLAYSRTIRLYDFARKGDYSYGTYLYGFPIQQMIFNSSLASLLSFPGYVVACMICSILAGMTSWNVIEKPLMKKARVATATPGLRSSQA